jgi:hypothetical protein
MRRDLVSARQDAVRAAQAAEEAGPYILQPSPSFIHNNFTCGFFD